MNLTTFTGFNLLTGIRMKEGFFWKTGKYSLDPIPHLEHDLF